MGLPNLVAGATLLRDLLQRYTNTTDSTSGDLGLVRRARRGVSARLIANVPEQEAFVVERWGAYNRTLDTGVHGVLPIVDRVAHVVPLGDVLIPLPPHSVETKDGFVLHVDADLHVKVTNPYVVAYSIGDPARRAIDLALMKMALRIASHTCVEAWQRQDELSGSMVSSVTAGLKSHGLQCVGYDLLGLRLDAFAAGSRYHPNAPLVLQVEAHRLLKQQHNILELVVQKFAALKEISAQIDESLTQMHLGTKIFIVSFFGLTCCAGLYRIYFPIQWYQHQDRLIKRVVDSTVSAASWGGFGETMVQKYKKALLEKVAAAERRRLQMEEQKKAEEVILEKKRKLEEREADLWKFVNEHRRIPCSRSPTAWERLAYRRIEGGRRH